MKKKLISVLIANLFLAAPAFAQSDAFKLEGSVSLGGIATDENAVDASKLNEYRDLSNGALFGWDVKGRSSKYWVDFFGENIARDDQYINLRGGVYDLLKYRLYTDSLKHNFLYGGITPYAGAGSANNTASGFPLLNTTTWNSVDVGYKRRDDGGYFEFQGASPWYFRVDGNQVTQSGGKVGASSQGMSPGNGYVDLVFPTEFTTRNATVEGGYSSKKLHVAMSWMTSKFENDNETVRWTNGFWNSGVDTTYLGADNKYSRFLVNATLRDLPFASTLAVRYTQDELESNFAVGTTVLGIAAGTPTGTLASLLPTGPNNANYNGKVENETFTVSLASQPTKGLDTRIYYNDFKRDDKSTHMAFTSAPVTTTTYMNEPYSYEKKNWGVDGYYRINRANRVGAGYDYLEMEREGRFDFGKTEDRTWFAEWKSSMISGIGMRLKYSNLDRKSDFLLANDGVNANDVLYWNRFLKAYDAADMKQDKWKFTLDASPLEYMDVSVEAIYKNNDYKNMVLGRLKDERREIYGSLSYGDPGVARFTVFGDYEKVEYQSQHRVVGTSTATTPPGPYDPNMPPTATNFNWQGSNRNQNYAYGISADAPVGEKLKLMASVMYYKTDGQLDFAAPPTIAAAAYPVPVSAWDDSTRTAINLKGIYAFSKTISFTAGYAYEKYDYKDAQYDGYRYTIPAAGRADSYLLGYYANPNYKANIFYASVAYKF